MVRSVLVGVLVVVALSAAGYAGWQLVTSRDHRVCPACQRPIHGLSDTTASVGGKPTVFCCPACALLEHKQSAGKVVVTALTDYRTSADISPEGAFVVRGSDTQPCVHSMATRGDYERPVQVSFDRCWPSMVAFATRDSAARFAREHGGQVIAFPELAASYR